MDRFLDLTCSPEQLSPLTLAFIGDAVFEIFVREMLVCEANRPVNKLHAEATKFVKAQAQAAAVEKIKPLLTDTEVSVLKRGRNAHTNHKAKNADHAAYHYATGFEALFGYLYLKGEIDRLRKLFDVVVRD